MVVAFKFMRRGHKLRYHLAKGVNLQVQPTQKFTVTKLLVSFATPQTFTNATTRNLLANLLVSGSQHYPSQTAIARRLADMYGADLNAYVARIGTAHTIRFSSTFVNDHFSQPGMLGKQLDFMREIIFQPRLVNGRFDPQIWRVQRDNLMAAYQSVKDDKQYYAAQQLMKEYYRDDSPMQMPSAGTSERLASVDNDQTVAAYRSMLANDQVDIVVIGDVDPETVAAQLKQWPLADRQALAINSLYYSQPLWREPHQKIEHQSVMQAKLDLAYSLPVYYGDSSYDAMVVLNSLFGGSAYSLMFNNIREKESLAYYAESSLRPLSGHLVVETGINASTYQRVRQLIDEQLAKLRHGMFSDTQFNQVKKNLLNQYRGSMDNLSAVASRRLINQVLGVSFKEDVASRLANVDRQKIMDLASKMSLQAIFFLNGGR